jgi:hypothetical protein
MMDYRHARAALAYMRQALEQAEATAVKIERHWRDEAEAIAMEQAAKSRRCARHQTSWTRADEYRYQCARERLFPRFGRDLERVQRKIERQRLAIEAHQTKYRFNA